MLEQQLQRPAGIADQPQRGGLVAHQLLGVDVDADQSPVQREAVVEYHVVVGLAEFGTHGEDHVRLAGEFTHRRQRGVGAEIQWVIATQQTLGVDGGGAWRVETFDELARGLGGIHAAPAEQHQRALGLAQPVGGLRQPGRVGRRAIQLRAGPLSRRRDRCIEQIDGDLDMHRPRARRGEHREGAGQYLGQRGGVEQGMAEARHPGQRLLLAGQFVQPALAAPQGVAAVDAGDHQHRHRVGQRLAHRGGDIGHPRTGDDQADPGLAAGTGVAIGHEPGALFVARGDVADRLTFQAAIQLDGVHAGNAEYGVDGVAFAQQADQQFSAGHDGPQKTKVCAMKAMIGRVIAVRSRKTATSSQSLSGILDFSSSAPISDM